MPVTSEREYRSMQVRVKESETESDEKVVEGYFTTFEEPYLLGSYRDWDNTDVEVWEVVDTEAFKDTDMSDVIMQYDHQGRVFARVSNGTLSIGHDEHGQSMRANLGGTTIGNQLYEEIKGGYTTKMSFGFTVSKDTRTEERIEEEGKNPVIRIVRRILSVGKLYDVSAVSLPANDMTEISARNFSNGVIEEVKAERLKEREMEEEKRKLALRIKILNGGN